MSVFDNDLKYIAGQIEKLNFEDSVFFITGATGLIGSVLIKALLKYNALYCHCCRVIGLVRDIQKVEKIFDMEKADSNLEFCICDVTGNISYNGKVDYVIHAASETKSINMISNPVETIWTSVCGTKNMLDFACSKKVKGFVYLSSMEVFGKAKSKDKRVTEKQLGYIDLENVRSCYPESKRLAENMCVCYLKEYGLPVTVARLAQTFGAGVPSSDMRVFAQFARSIINNQDIVLHTSGNSYGNYVYTADAAVALFLLLKEGVSGEVYTVVNEESTMRIKDMAYLLANEIAGGQLSVVFDIPNDDKYGYAPDTILSLSSQKLRDLGWQPKYGLKESYERLILDWSAE